MIKLLVIADDFTGALDTGIQFGARSAKIRVTSVEQQGIFGGLDEKFKVLILDTETRHVAPGQAYREIYRIVSEAAEAGIPYIYKKTDSGMRGNIGSELSAMLAASGQKRVHFVPAFPQMNRRTVNGVQYIGDLPVAESVFGSDPFEPVHYSSVSEIIASQSAVETHMLGPDVSGELPRGVLIYNSDTMQDLEQIACHLKQRNELHLLAGCAGFASVLPGLLELEPGGGKLPVLHEGLLVVCGSINPITIRQMDEAERQGARRIRMRPEQKLRTDWLDTPEGKHCLEKWLEQIEKSGCAILESASDLGQNTVRQYAGQMGLPQGEIRFRIADTMGTILKRLMDMGLRRTMMVTGGDTLLAFMEKLRLRELSPVGQPFPGVVLSQIQYQGNVYNLISKSGGFGKNSLLIDLEHIIQNADKEELVC